MAQEIGGVGDTIFKVFYFASRDPGMEIQSIIYKLYIQENKQSIKLRRTNDTFTLTLDIQCCRAKMHGGILKIDERILKTK